MRLFCSSKTKDRPINGILIIKHHKFLKSYLFITSALCPCAWKAIWATYLPFPFWALSWHSESLFYLSLLWALYWWTGSWRFWLLWVLNWRSGPFFSSFIRLRFSSVMKLSVCASYVNCSSDLFVVSSNLAFWVWCTFSIFSKCSLKLLLGWVTAASASLCLPGDFISLFTYLRILKIK